MRFERIFSEISHFPAEFQVVLGAAHRLAGLFQTLTTDPSTSQLDDHMLTPDVPSACD